ncbi:hypothetical protein A2477_03085 [Candidatus Falkowbacteria bacterium RIFOXYC2_FULL_47_12]|uniref:Uncharacterized protein n=2 Tax=Candidatus Falkowiibacteriota TaxID=1752728 RepID=A0A1F5TQW4_9BACT|nr:MAG: hypothetical protein A2242_01780 [Candidatus Falkowbacteria bacterium RIFOXYA2_FULL_47_9]OGF41315.1 MAG: hypothetical protein A2477_03085 [Candidatus Falkowbacteria bacterium RIFOXYC2_FULL_47_12]
MLKIIARELFYVFTAAILIFSLMELIAPNIVQAHISLNLILILWLASGMVLLVMNKNQI